MLGYIAYVLVCAFGPVQLYNMVRRRNTELGNIPLITLTIGLALLEAAVIRDGAPLYIIAGNGVALFFNLAGLAWVVFRYYRAQRPMRYSPNTRFQLTPLGRQRVERMILQMRKTKGEN